MRDTINDCVDREFAAIDRILPVTATYQPAVADQLREAMTVVRDAGNSDEPLKFHAVADAVDAILDRIDAHSEIPGDEDDEYALLLVLSAVTVQCCQVVRAASELCNGMARHSVTNLEHSGQVLADEIDRLNHLSLSRPCAVAARAALVSAYDGLQ